MPALTCNRRHLAMDPEDVGTARQRADTFRSNPKLSGHGSRDGTDRLSPQAVHRSHGRHPRASVRGCRWRSAASASASPKLPPSGWTSGSTTRRRGCSTRRRRRGKSCRPRSGSGTGSMRTDFCRRCPTIPARRPDIRCRNSRRSPYRMGYDAVVRHVSKTHSGGIFAHLLLLAAVLQRHG